MCGQKGSVRALGIAVEAQETAALLKVTAVLSTATAKA